MPLPHNPAEDEHIHGSSPEVILFFLYVLDPNFSSLRFGSVEKANPLRKADQSKGVLEKPPKVINILPGGGGWGGVGGIVTVYM